MVKTGGNASIGTSKVTFRGTFTAAIPCEEGGIGIRFSNIASASCSEG